jgi:predicted permease
MDRLAQDVRSAFRQIRRRPLFAAVAVLSLALGIGASTAVFSLANAVLLRPVEGVSEPDRVVELGRQNEGRGFDTFAYPDYLDLSRQVDAFQATAAFTFEMFSLARGGEGERITGMQVSPAYFAVMGVTPSEGRFFTDDEDLPGSRPAVVVLDHAFWRNRMGGDPAILGSTVEINRVPFTVVGVGPEDFHGHTVGFRPDVYVPVRAVPLLDPGVDEFDDRRASWHMAVARLAPGATLDEARTQVTGVFQRLAGAYPDTNAGRSADVVPLGLVPGAARTGVAAFLGVLTAMVGLILLVTCANVAGMFVARAASREREIAVRLALGSGRRRLVHQLLTESLLVFAMGGAAGTVLGLSLLAVIPLEQLPVPIPIHVDLSPDLTVLGFALLATLGTGVVFGLLPALGATRLELTASLKEDGRGKVGIGRLRRVFASAQVGLSLVLLVTAALFLRSLQHAASVETGFDPADRYMTMVELDTEGYEEPEGRLFQRRLVESLRGLPGVHGAALAIDLPLDLARSGTSAHPEDWNGGDEGLGVEFNYVSPGYFAALGIPLLSGRDFGENEGPDAEPVVVVSRAFAERVWSGEEALGRRLRVSMPGIREEWRTVVGVVEDTKNQLLTETPEPFVYVPLWQAYRTHNIVVVHADGGMAAVAPMLRGTILELDGSLALTPVVGLDRYTGLGILPQRVAALLSSALGLLALLLSGIGIYGVVAMAVTQRTREIGVRMALGAGSRRILALVLRGGMALALPGVLVGTVVALGVGRVLRFLLLGLSPTDPIALGVVAGLLTVVVLVASVVPARRAARVHPVDALRAD